jgi:hypothetical protein
MAASKYSKYIITEQRFDSLDAALPPGVDPESVFNTKSHRRIMSLDDLVLKGASHMGANWTWPGGSDVYPETAISYSHAHDFDETLGFFGTDFEDPYKLHGEIEFWIEDEKLMLTRSCLIFIPKGMYHCPLVIHKVERPIFHFGGGPAPAYTEKIATK